MDTDPRAEAGRESSATALGAVTYDAEYSNSTEATSGSTSGEDVGNIRAEIVVEDSVEIRSSESTSASLSLRASEASSASRSTASGTYTAVIVS